MADPTEWFLALAAVGVPLVSFILAVGSLSRSNRLRRSLGGDVAVLKDMQDGAAKDALRRHVDRTTRALMAEVEPRSPREARLRRRAWRWYAAAAVGYFVFAGPVVLAPPGHIPLDPRSGWLGDLASRSIALIALVGAVIGSRAEKSYQARKRLLTDEAGR